jgi:glycine hydroxymethyltransferase
MAHFAGLVAAGLHPSPGAVRGRRHLHRAQDAGRAALRLHPEQAGVRQEDRLRRVPGPAGRTRSCTSSPPRPWPSKSPAADEFKERQERTLEGARIIAERLGQPDLAAAGISVLSGGTDVHLVLVDLRHSELDGQQGEDRLHTIGITVNRNAVPFDPRPPMVSSGLRIGTPALATRGFDAAAFTEVAEIIATALVKGTSGSVDVDALQARVDKLAADFPLYPQHEQW